MFTWKKIYVARPISRENRILFADGIELGFCYKIFASSESHMKTIMWTVLLCFTSFLWGVTYRNYQELQLLNLLEKNLTMFLQWLNIKARIVVVSSRVFKKATCELTFIYLKSAIVLGCMILISKANAQRVRIFNSKRAVTCLQFS